MSGSLRLSPFSKLGLKFLLYGALKQHGESMVRFGALASSLSMLSRVVLASTKRTKRGEPASCQLGLLLTIEKPSALLHLRHSWGQNNRF